MHVVIVEVSMEYLLPAFLK